MKKVILAFSIILFALTGYAQQDPLYSQYFNSPMIINPAFAGSMDRLFVGMAHRSQWSGVEGAPTTLNFNSHIALAGNKVGAGIAVISDMAGSNSNSFYGGAVSYKIKFNSYSSFSFGMQMGIMQYTSDQQGLNILNPDERFAPYTVSKFNTGMGILLRSDRYSIGASVPQFLNSTTSVGSGSPEDVKIYSRNYYLFGSYTMLIQEHLEFKPSALLRFTAASKSAIDVNANFTFNKLYTAGIIIRNLNTAGLLLQGIYKSARLAYVFEVPLKKSALQYNTHELSLAFSLALLGNHSLISNF